MKFEINKNNIKKYILSLLLAGIGFLLFIGLNIYNLFFCKEKELVFERAGYNDISVHEFYVSGLTGNKEKIKLDINPMKIDESEEDKLFNSAMNDIKEIIRGDNISLMEIDKNIKFISYLEEYDMYVNIVPADLDLVDINGKVLNKDLEDFKDSFLNVRLNIGDKSRDFIIPICIYPKKLTNDELIIKKFISHINKIEEKRRQDKYVKIENSFEGKNLIFYKKRNMNLYILPVICFLSAVLLVVKDRQKIRDKDKKEKEEMLTDYPDIVSKFMLYLGCGFSIRKCIEIISNSYTSDIENRGYEKRTAYEKIKKMNMQLNAGANEGRLFRDFGREFGLRQYMKLMSLLDQNRKTGVSGLYGLLQDECDNAWNERVNLAKRKGEECSTKLILPLILMLSVVLIVVAAPAIISFV